MIRSLILSLASASGKGRLPARAVSFSPSMASVIFFWSWVLAERWGRRSLMTNTGSSGFSPRSICSVDPSAFTITP